MRLIPLILVTAVIFIVVLVSSARSRSSPSAVTAEFKQQYRKKPVRSVDHAKLPALQKVFRTGGDVTETCISCHTERHKEVMASSHWNWSRQEYVPGRGIRTVGKRNVLNNFCIGVSDNQEGCSRCHAGYGQRGNDYDFSDVRNVDCLACHDTTDTYTKGLAGLPDNSVDLSKVARNVGRPRRANCGSCHFDGGGGNNVKHGDLEQALLTAARDVDVHMAVSGGDLDCIACHKTRNHQMLGKLYAVSSMNRNRSTCEQCHSGAPHSSDILNEHTLKVACQTCHIPRYAKVNETKLTWDWSTAGRLRNGEPYEDKNSSGNPVYASIKGSFTWARNVKPEYVFFNGTAEHYLLGDQVPPERPVQVNRLLGSYDDPDSKITPVKVHRGRQPFDPVNGVLIQPKLYARQKGEGGFWKDFDWNRAAEEGMKAAGVPFSGTVGFAETEMYWPVNHMVAPKEQSLQCVECHTRNNSRLASLKGFYMPGRDRNKAVETAGMWAVGLAFTGSALHAAARLRAHLRRRADR